MNISEFWFFFCMLCLFLFCLKFCWRWGQMPGLVCFLPGTHAVPFPFTYLHTACSSFSVSSCSGSLSLVFCFEHSGFLFKSHRKLHRCIRVTEMWVSQSGSKEPGRADSRPLGKSHGQG